MILEIINVNAFVSDLVKGTGHRPTAEQSRSRLPRQEDQCSERVELNELLTKRRPLLCFFHVQIVRHDGHVNTADR
jgi:hypothetical protein